MHSCRKCGMPARGGVAIGQSGICPYCELIHTHQGMVRGSEKSLNAWLKDYRHGEAKAHMIVWSVSAAARTVPISSTG